MIVIGADVHKSTHALAAVDAATGQLLGEREIAAREQGHLEALRWAQELGDELVWAIEVCRDLSHHLEHALIAAGERVLRVAPNLMGGFPRAPLAEGNASRESPVRSTPERSPERSCASGSSGSPQRSWIRRRWRFGCSAITATRLYASAPG
jgi:transposase